MANPVFSVINGRLSSETVCTKMKTSPDFRVTTVYMLITKRTWAISPSHPHKKKTFKRILWKYVSVFCGKLSKMKSQLLVIYAALVRDEYLIPQGNKNKKRSIIHCWSRTLSARQYRERRALCRRTLQTRIIMSFFAAWSLEPMGYACFVSQVI